MHVWLIADKLNGGGVWLIADAPGGAYVRTYVRRYVRTYVRTYVGTYVRIRTSVRTYVRTYVRRHSAADQLLRYLQAVDGIEPFGNVLQLQVFA